MKKNDIPEVLKTEEFREVVNDLMNSQKWQTKELKDYVGAYVSSALEGKDSSYGLTGVLCTVLDLEGHLDAYSIVEIIMKTVKEELEV